MIGLDTNVLARYFAQDHPQQSARATALIESLDAQHPGFLCQIALAELVWVLQSAYKVRKPQLVCIIERLLMAPEIVVENTESTLQALHRFAESTAGFADCLIERCGHQAGCSDTLTFDRKAARTAGMRLLND
ncbi:type II toxin-antitoxin system VapC family toxin [Herbaspirillum sp. C9C3]|uniref:PIN domain-containing protein n=1 Tax=Herbaspirillum sp. C9C3 TaxID=2735271 RepID=UPI0015848FD7|nr:type II toxin-antitoxin system VapC family toxin [Herbaspirillum sp. C9C3]NUT62667.1 type II toxin-antitoxin system VapC family toxin [Herbaspirillum sp. C9C3]